MNTMGSYTCLSNMTMIICPNGYEKINNRCVDIDECKTGTHNCNPISQICRNTPSAFECDCKPNGSTLTPRYHGEDGECLLFEDACQITNACPKNSKCKPDEKNRFGLSCSCPEGFEWFEEGRDPIKYPYANLYSLNHYLFHTHCLASSYPYYHD